MPKLKPCTRCGGPKEPGHRRHLCDACRAIPRKTHRDNCASCGLTRDGHHPTYCRRCYHLYNLARRYGLTAEDVAALEAAHDVCAVCGVSGRKLHVDHDHDTGRVRGMLCVRCNAAASLVDADPGWLAAMAAYLGISTDTAV